MLCAFSIATMPMKADHLADTIETSAGGLIEELHAVRDSVEELYILLDHIWRNREELHDILAAIIEKKTEESNEVTCCIHCDAFCPSVAEAIKAGWTSLQHDPTEGWDYLGICANCQRGEVERQRVAQQERTKDLESTGREMGLTTRQIEQAKAEGVTSALGLRRIEANTRADQIPETIACAHCDADSPESLAAASQEGWTRLQQDDGAGWNYLGVCPECQAQENQTAESELRPTDPQKHLFG
jgi:hypothetical protein